MIVISLIGLVISAASLFVSLYILGKIEDVKNGTAKIANKNRKATVIDLSDPLDIDLGDE